MEKQNVTETVFSKHNDHAPIKFGEIDIELRPDDIILAGHDEGYYSENNSWDARYYLEVNRDRLETDEEFKKRKEDNEWHRKDLRKRRYQNYLKLKKEFEDDSEIRT